MMMMICKIPFFKTYHYLLKVPIFPPLSIASFSTSSTPKISVFDYLLNHHHFSPESASKVSSLSSTNYLNKPQNADSVLNFLKQNGFEKNHLETLLQNAPWILSANLDRIIKPKITFFQALGFRSADLAVIVSASPLILRSNVDKLGLSVFRLKNILGPDVDVCKFLQYSGHRRLRARACFGTTLMPNVKYLKSCGICPLQIVKLGCASPSILFTNPDKFKDFVQRVDEMGVDRKSEMFIYAVRVVSCMSRKNWELKLKLFRDLGFSERNISNVFAAAPLAFGISERKIKEVTQLLLSVEGLSISDIVCNPVLLSYSVDKRLKPRLRVLKALENQNFLDKKPGLLRFLRMSDADFRKKYMIPCLKDELGDLYVDSQGS
ncbi:Mitochondrial transcription termination factor family protein [Euphorbia peplus]|nr:Mitochondrial transcription termination factor family protein [Euphorbia peplus]